MNSLTTEQLRRAIEVSETIEELQAQLTRLYRGGTLKPPGGKAGKRKGISAAQRARRQKTKQGGQPKGKRTMSAAARARISAAAKKRWQAAKAAGKTRL